MEEKKQKTNVQKKLSYDELENAAKQISAQFDAVIKENNQLKVMLQKAQLTNLYTELDFKFKVLQNAEMFSTEFVETCVKSIEEIMTPEVEETKEDEQS
jgi:hypothetical protein